MGATDIEQVLEFFDKYKKLCQEYNFLVRNDFYTDKVYIETDVCNDCHWDELRDHFEQIEKNIEKLKT